MHSGRSEAPSPPRMPGLRPHSRGRCSGPSLSRTLLLFPTQVELLRLQAQLSAASGPESPHPVPGSTCDERHGGQATRPDKDGERGIEADGIPTNRAGGRRRPGVVSPGRGRTPGAWKQTRGPDPGIYRTPGANGSGRTNSSRGDDEPGARRRGTESAAETQQSSSAK